MVEECLVVPRKALFGYNDERAFSGFKTPAQLGFDLEEVLQKHSSFGWRKTSKEDYDVEYDESFKHFNPSAVFLYDNKIFTYTRIGGEPRLIGRNDILISGHVNPEDKQSHSYNTTFLSTLHREFGEEVDYQSHFSIDPTPLGYVNDESPNLIDKVHFGIVYLIHGNSPDINVKEKDIMVGTLKTVEEIENLERPLESWSKYIFDEIKKYDMFSK
ncbi:MAG: hypothetical protein Q8R47_03730 [Nanoarchaeota archaeon]|nr:hypothetical protein [Nanoarchaeota archaeon]